MSGPRLCVAALHRNALGEILLVRRGKPPLEGVWTLPGGGVKFNERLEDAARREFTEEVALVAGAMLRVAEHEYFGEGFHLVTALYVVLDATGTAHAGDDASELMWVSHEHLDRFETTRDLIELAFRGDGTH